MYIERIWVFFYQGFNYDISFIVSWPEACSTERAPVSVAKFLYTHNTNRERSLYAKNTLGINFVSRQKYDAPATEDQVVACNELVSS